MLTFGAPHMMALLLVVPVALALVWLGARTRRRRLARWASAAVADRLAVGIAPWRRRVRTGLVLAGLTGCAVALIRPQWGFHYEEVIRRGIDLVLLVDVSESMRAEDVSPSRLERAKREISDFLDLVQGDRVALVAFAGTSFVQCPLTLDYGAVREFLRLVDTDLIPTPGTDLGAALATAGRAMEPSGPSRGKAVVLISDGGNLEGDPVAAAKALHERNITIYAVGIGDPNTAVPIPDADGTLKSYDGNVVTTRLEESTLTAVAAAGGGVYVRAVTGDLDLEKIYADIRERHTTAELGRSQQKVYHERFAWPLGFGVLCLILEACLAERGRTVLATLCVLALARPAAADVSGDMARGIAAYEKENPAAAVEAFTKAHEAAPSDVRTRFGLGTAEYQAQAYESALRRFTDAAAAATDPALRAHSWYNAGNAHAQLGQFDEAADAFERSLRMNPNDRDAKANLELVRRLIEEREQEQSEREGEEKTSDPEQEGQDEEDGAPGEGDNQNDKSDPASQPTDAPQPEPESGQQPQPEPNADGSAEPQPDTPPQQTQHPDGEDAQEGQATPAGSMTRDEADQWLQQLPSDDADALKDFWRRQQPHPQGPRRRDW